VKSLFPKPGSAGAVIARRDPVFLGKVSVRG